MTENEPQFATMRDGRKLAYAEYGTPRGAPAFYFHGTPGGRLEGRHLDEAARLHNVRLIAVDRPGYGHSDFKRDRKIEDWPADVADLAETLSIDRFAVVGLSGGGPHAQACAAAMPGRVTTAAIVSGAGSPEATLDGHGRIARIFLRAMLALSPIFAWWTALWTAFWAPRTKQWMIPRWIDRVVMRRREVREAFAEEVRDALRPGGKAMAQDLVLFSRPWGFSPRDVGAVPVRLWHGDADKVVPVSIGRYYAREIPGCRATFVEGAGHMMILDHAFAIMSAVQEAAIA